MASGRPAVARTREAAARAVAAVEATRRALKRSRSRKFAMNEIGRVS